MATHVQVTQVRLVFCEGAHDAGFMQLVLSNLHKFESKKLKFSELPYPFADIFKKNVENNAATDLRLDMAKKFFLPDYVLQNNEKLVMLFNYGGSDRKNSVLPLLDKLILLIRDGAAFGVLPEVRYLFMADADAQGSKVSRTKIASDFKVVAEKDWLSDGWVPSPKSRAFHHMDLGAEVAAYVWRKWEADSGTLEDVVHECWTEHDSLKAALAFLDSHFVWKTETPETEERICAENAKRLKAGFCIAGQREEPGSSLSVILKGGKLLSIKGMTDSLSVSDLSTFLKEWL